MEYAYLSDIPVTLPPAPRWARLRRLLFGNALARRIGAQAAALEHIDALAQKTQRSTSMANADQPAGSFGSGYGYEDDIREVSVALKYKREIEAGFPDGGDSKGLYAHSERVLSDLVTQTGARMVINFGVSYAYVDARLAASHPSVQFIGVDRSVLTKALNEREFKSRSNLQIVASEILEFLKSGRFDGGILWTMRTGLLLPKPFLTRLYQTAAAAGIRHVVLIEPIGLSRQTLQPYRFSDGDQPSVALREGMFIHNYPGILRAAGFSVTRAELTAMGHRHADIKILSITASA